MMEEQNRLINRTHGSTLVIFARLWIYTPRLGMRKFEIAQVYYAEDETQFGYALINTVSLLFFPPATRQC